MAQNPADKYKQEQGPWLKYQAATTAPEPESTQPAGMLDVAKTMIGVNPIAQTVIGAGKDALKTGLNLYNMMGRNNPLDLMPRPGVNQQGMTPINQPKFQLPEKPPEWMEPSNTEQKIGAGLSTIGQFMLPSTAISRIPGAAKAPLIARALMEGLGSGGVSVARGDTAPDATRNAYTTAGITAALGTAGKFAGPFGERIEQILLKPLKVDLQDVKGPPEQASRTMIQNLFKYDLGGTLTQSYEKAQALTKELGNKLRQVMGPNTSSVDLFDLLRQTTAELRANKAKTFLENENLSKAVDKVLTAIRIQSKSGKVNIADAQDIKQAVGAMGAWSHGVRDADAKAMEIVANTYYSKIRNAIEKSSGHSKEVQDINRQFSEIIPIKNALLRRIPVNERREMLSIKEFIGLATLNPKVIALSGADRMMRSGTVANALVQAGKAPTQNAARVAPGLTGSMDALIKSLQQAK